MVEIIEIIEISFAAGLIAIAIAIATSLMHIVVRVDFSKNRDKKLLALEVITVIATAVAVLACMALAVSGGVLLII